ncbi:hypothetical protein SHL15_1239 [Streptomyces hygroscopicus subsp. limoneus]|nr:hypothetical protein SHL15_1239 [Streptomyces hygroscopicus subsp. limoneus]
MRHKLRPPAAYAATVVGTAAAKPDGAGNCRASTIEGYAATVDDVEALMAGEEPLGWHT